MPLSMPFGLRQRGVALMDDDREQHPLDWIDGYVARLREFIFVREEDCLLIKVPNEAHKLNRAGVRMLKALLDGEGISDFWKRHGGTPEARRDIYDFFIALKRLLQGCVNEQDPPRAVTVRPFALGFNSLPVLSEIAVTYRCNLACRFCYAGCSCKKGVAGDMSDAEIRRILRIIREEAQVPSVSFTGGEPTLRPELPAWVRYARHELGMRVNLITNGTMIDETLAGALADAGLHSAQVSVEAPLPAVHDALVRCDGAHDRAVRAVRLLLDRGVLVHTNSTLNRMNLEFAAGMPAFVKGLGLKRLSMNLVIPTAAAETGDDINVTYTEIGPHILNIQQAAAAAGVEFMWYSPTPVCLFNPILHQLGNKGCAACDGLLSVSPSGDVLPCSSWPEPVGNLLREDFRSVWDGVRGKWLREKRFAPDSCQPCEDFALCQGACPLYWRHFGCAELEELCHAVVQG